MTLILALALAAHQPGVQSAPVAAQAGDWRQQMIARGTASVSVDQALANLTRNLSLTPLQAAKIRPILQQHHDRILAILRTAPATMTHDDFMAQVHRISAETHDQVQLGTPARI
jgi:hypothetical protein